jgi:putative sulfotransferase
MVNSSRRAAQEEPVSVPTFIVGTGRCGSTMLSNMLREHPKVLSLSEFFSFASDFSPTFSEIFFPDPMDGRRFWPIIGGIKPLVSLSLRLGIAPPESIYPCGAPNALFSSQTGVPAILHTTLPHLTDDHDRLYSALQDAVITWPEARIGEHYRHLFGWLAEHFDKRLWVERSGGFIFAVEQLLATFPGAKFIHLVRDGRDASLSMQEHVGFRLALVMGSLQQCLGVDPRESPDRSRIDRVPEELRRFLPEQFDIDAFYAFAVPLKLTGELWTQWMSDGLNVLRSVPTDRVLTLRYEDFFTQPKQQLDALAAFLGEEFIDEDWSARCAATVRKPRSTWRDLPDEDACALTEACRPGFERLAAAGVHYDL